jgi:hypothetical protein
MENQDTGVRVKVRFAAGFDPADIADTLPGNSTEMSADIQ